MTDDLTAYAHVGFAREPNPHLWSSPAWLAHELGWHLRDTGRAVPTDVRMGRGDSIWCREKRYKVTYTKGSQAVAFERVE